MSEPAQFSISTAALISWNLYKNKSNINEYMKIKSKTPTNMRKKIKKKINNLIFNLTYFVTVPFNKTFSNFKLQRLWTLKKQ